MKPLYRSLIISILTIFTLVNVVHGSINKLCTCSCCGQSTCTCNIELLTTSNIHNTQIDLKTLCCYNTSCNDIASGAKNKTFFLTTSFEEFSRKIIKFFVTLPGHTNKPEAKTTDELNPIIKHLVPEPSLFPLNVSLRL